MHVMIQGGTHAGWRAVKERAPWTHDCAARLADARTGEPIPMGVRVAVTIAGHLYSCPACGARRP